MGWGGIMLSRESFFVILLPGSGTVELRRTVWFHGRQSFGPDPLLRAGKGSTHASIDPADSRISHLPISLGQPQESYFDHWCLLAHRRRALWSVAYFVFHQAHTVRTH